MKGKRNKIGFHFLNPVPQLQNRRKLKLFIEELFANENRELAQIDYIFCSDSYLLQLNQQHLQHDTLTDIITFELSNRTESVVSEIYISAERVKENAQKFETTFAHELHRVIFHGALHLCGYKDKTRKEQELMRQKEEQYLALYFVSRETA